MLFHMVFYIRGPTQSHQPLSRVTVTSPLNSMAATPHMCHLQLQPVDASCYCNKWTELINNIYKKINLIRHNISSLNQSAYFQSHML